MPNNLKISLKNKVEYFLWKSALPGRGKLEEMLLKPALQVGEIGLIGGAIRDLAYLRAPKFRSDLDFIIDVKNSTAFKEMVSNLDVSKNSFGGYRSQIAGLKIDFWEINNSWARTHNIVSINCLDDVRKSTFFNLDAVIFDIRAKKLLVDDSVLKDIEDRYLDINLRENPNEDGAAVRALRRLWKFDLYASGRLIEFIATRIEVTGWKKLIERDLLAFPEAPVLNTLHSIFGDETSSFIDFMNQDSGRIPRARQSEFKLVSK